MNAYVGHNSSGSTGDTRPLLEEPTLNPLDKQNALIRNDLSQIKTLHTMYKKKIRRNKSEYHHRMKQLLEYDSTKLVYILSIILFILLVAVLVGLIYFSDSFFMYSIFISTLSAVFIILTCINSVVTNSRRKRIKMFGKS